MSKRSFSGRGVALAVALSATLAASPSLAFDSFLVGPRAMGMGGANVASVSDTTAQYYNPAAFGFFGCTDKNGERLTCDNNNLGRKDWGMDINASGGYRMNGDFGSYVDDLSEAYDSGILDRLSTNGIQSDSDLKDLIEIFRDLDGLDTPGTAITADLNAGLGIRFGHMAIGGRGYFQAAGLVQELDTANLGLAVNGTSLSADISSLNIEGNDGQRKLITDEQEQVLTDAGFELDAIQIIDFLAREQGITETEIQGVTDLLASAGDATAELDPSLDPSSVNALQNNTTTIVLSGFAVGEAPISYGYAINDHWSVGANLKLMQGRVYGNEIIVFAEDSGDVIAQTDENYEDSTTFGVDVGVMGRYRFVNFGVVGRNLNSPKFDGPTINEGTTEEYKFDDVTIDPQVTAGVAFIPFETLILEADYDLTENETVLKGYDNQRLSFGLEWDAFRTLALRAGAYKNLAEDDIDWVYTAGLGLNLWAARLDLAGAFSTDKIEYDGEEIPQEIRVAAQLAVDF